MLDGYFLFVVVHYMLHCTVDDGHSGNATNDSMPDHRLCCNHTMTVKSLKYLDGLLIRCNLIGMAQPMFEKMMEIGSFYRLEFMSNSNIIF